MRSTLLDFTFPVFAIKHKVTEKDNIVYAELPDKTLRIIDNKNLSGGSLALRRLKIDKKKIYRLSNSIFTFAQLLRQHKSDNYYITETGKWFKYKKTKYVPLIYRRIISKEYIVGFGIRVKVSGVQEVFSLPAGTFVDGYLGLLKIGYAHLIYEVSKERKPDSRRMI